MANEEVIKKLLVEIGYKSDTASQNAAMDSVNSLTSNIVKLGTAIAAAYSVDKIIQFNRAMVASAYEANKIGSSALNLDAFAKAGESAGFSIQTMKGAVQNLSDFIKTHASKTVEDWFDQWADFKVIKDNVTGQLKDIDGNIIETQDAIFKLFDNVKKRADEIADPGVRQAWLLNWLKTFQFTEDQFNASQDKNLRRMYERYKEINKLYFPSKESYQAAEDEAQKFTENLTTTLLHLGNIYKRTMFELQLSKPLEELNTYLDEHGSEISGEITKMAESADKFAKAIGGWEVAFGAAFAFMYPRLALLVGLLKLYSDMTDKKSMKEHDERARKGESTLYDKIIDLIWTARPVPKNEKRQLPDITIGGEDATKENTEATKENTTILQKFTDWFFANVLTEAGRNLFGNNMVNEQRAKLGIGGTGPGGSGGSGGGGSGEGGGGGYGYGRGKGGSSGRGETGEGTGSQLKEVIDKAAKEAGIDPRIMYGIHAGESGHGSNYDIGDKGTSFGPFQFRVVPGAIGDRFKRETGKDPRDPSTIPDQAKWLANYIKRGESLSPWRGNRGPMDWNPSWGSAGYSPPGVATGKSVDTKSDVEMKGVQSSLMEKFNAAAEEYHKLTGKNATITDAFRTREQQEKYYQNYLSGRGGIAAPPGKSRHETGNALDVREADEMARLGILQRHGLHQPVKERLGRDAVHIEEIKQLHNMINLEERRHKKHVTQPLGHNWTTINNAQRSNTSNVNVGGMHTNINVGGGDSANVGLIGHTVRQENLKFANKLRRMGTIIGT